MVVGPYIEVGPALVHIVVEEALHIVVELVACHIEAEVHIDLKEVHTAVVEVVHID